MHNQIHIDYLLGLGLNQLEAEVYVALLPEEPMTAYKIGKMIGKPTANVYKAIDILARKGAVMIEEGKNRKCRAVDAPTFIAQLQLDFSQKSQEALIALANVGKEMYDEHIYQIQSPALAFAKAKEMLGRADQIVVVDVFPKALDEIRSELEEAIDRGVKVFVETYQPTELKGADVAVPPSWNRTLKFWNSQQLNLVIDGKEYLAALFSNDLKRLHQANWSCNLYLACLMHSGRLSEHRVVKLLSTSSSAEREELVADDTFFYHDEVPGVQEIFKRYQKTISDE